MRKHWHPADEPDEVVFAACERFLFELGEHFKEDDSSQAKTTGLTDIYAGKEGPAALAAQWIKTNLPKYSCINRQSIYPLFWEAIRRKYLILMPPRNKELAKEIAYRYRYAPQYDVDPNIIQVVEAREELAHEQVANVGADLVLSLIEKVAQAKMEKTQTAKRKSKKEILDKAVHIGFGAGITGMAVARRIAQRIHNRRGFPRLVIHALSAGSFSWEHPEVSPNTYFRFFDDSLTKVECVGLYGPVVTDSRGYKKLKETPGMRESFRRAGEIDIVVTALASAQDKHGMLQQFLTNLIQEADKDTPEGKNECGTIREYLNMLRSADWKGELQFRPFSSTGPIKIDHGIRAVTLLELDDYKHMAEQKNKYVVLLASPCRDCKRTRTDALWHLMTQPALRLWNYLVIDIKTVDELLALPSISETP